MPFFWKSRPRRNEQQAQTQAPQSSVPSPSDEAENDREEEFWSSSEFYGGNAVTANPPNLRGVVCALGTPTLVEDVLKDASGSSFELILWRLNELEAKFIGTDLWERRVDAALTDLLRSQHDLQKQVGEIEDRLGLSTATPKKGSRRERSASPGHDDTNLPIGNSKQRRPSTSYIVFNHSEGNSSEPGSPSFAPTPIGRRTSSSLEPGLAALTPHSQRSVSQSSFAVNLREQGSLVSPEVSAGKAQHGPQHHSSTKERSNSTSNSNLGCSSINASGVARENSNSPQKKAKQVIRNFKSAISNNNAHEVLEVEADTDRTLSPTVWNAAFLIGMNRTGFFASALIAFLLFLNIAMQSVFLGVITNIVETELFDENEIEQLRSWRVFFAHSVNHYDTMSKTSLAQRVCAAGDATSTLPVEMSDSKAQLVESIQDYLPDEMALFSGPSLSVIAITFWTLKVIAELLDIWDTFHGMRVIPRGQRNILLESSTGAFRLANLTRFHKIFVAFILLARLTICISLWFLGIDFLVNYSIEPAELILNAVALEIVLSVDEVLFVLVPASCKTLMKRLEPLPKTRPVRQWSGLDLRSIFLTILLVVLISFIYMSKIVPLLARINQAQQVLCSGSQDFIFAVDPFMYVYTTETEGDVNDPSINSATITAIRELLDPDSIPLRTLLDTEGHFAMASSIMVGETTSELGQIATMTTDEAGAYFQATAGEFCSDLFIAKESFFLKEYALSEFGVENVTDCSQLKNYCNAAPLVRAACPVTCGCDIPLGEAFDVGASGGCPSACLKGSGRWNAQMANRQCEDVAQATLANDERWQMWGVQFSEGLDSASAGYEEVFDSACSSHGGNCTRMFIELGCGFIPVALSVFSDLDGDPCTGNWLGDVIEATWKPLAPICPVTCNCLNQPDLTIDTGLAACPASCKTTTTSTTETMTMTTSTTSSKTTTSAPASATETTTSAAGP